MQRILRPVIANALLASMMLSTPSTVQAAAEEPSYYPTGPQANINLESVTSGGWTLCFSETWAQTGTSVNQIKEDCAGDYIILTGRAIGSTNLDLLAAAPFDAVFQETVENTPHLSNGSWWYFTTGWSMGFANREIIEQNSCDVANNEVGELGFCWHLDPAGDPSDSLMDNGYQMNGIRLNSGTEYLREIYVSGGGDDPSISMIGSARLVGSTTEFANDRVRWVWLRCIREGDAGSSRRLPLGCRTVSRGSGLGSSLERRAYRLSAADRRSGYMRIAIYADGEWHYSSALSLR